MKTNIQRFRFSIVVYVLSSALFVGGIALAVVIVLAFLGNDIGAPIPALILGALYLPFLGIGFRLWFFARRLSRRERSSRDDNSQFSGE